MLQGLEVFDVNGNIVIDITDKLTKILDVIETNGDDGSYTDSRIVEGTFWYSPIYGIDVLLDELLTLKPPVVTVTDTTISWVYTDRNSWISPPYPTNPKYMLIYGVY